jgi:hypothetical protein
LTIVIVWRDVEFKTIYSYLFSISAELLTQMPRAVKHNSDSLSRKLLKTGTLASEFPEIEFY